MKKIILSLTFILSTGLILTLQAQARTPEIDRKQAEEQARINQGVRSGQITRGEAARLEAEQARIEADKRRAKADGVVTPAERRRLKREEDKASRDIYRAKHNGRVRRD